MRLRRTTVNELGAFHDWPAAYAFARHILSAGAAGLLAETSGADPAGQVLAEVRRVLGELGYGARRAGAAGGRAVPILNYTTTVTAQRTAGEVQSILGKAGASTVATTYDSGRPSGVSFVLDSPAGRAGYTLPVKVDGVRRALDRHAPPRFRSAAQAERVAWRIAKDWLEAQLALVEAGMAELAEVMLPYQVTGDGRTVYAVLASSAGARQALALEAAP